jgi:hypothetical protein
MFSTLVVSFILENLWNSKEVVAHFKTEMNSEWSNEFIKTNHKRFDLLRVFRSYF